jgi:hypothetical protein
MPRSTQAYEETELRNHVQEAIDAWGADFDNPNAEHDCQISGADMIEWFTQWRRAAIALLAKHEITMKYASIGSISHGTLDTEHLLTIFASELEYHVERNAKEWCSDDGRADRDQLMALINQANEIEDYDTEEASELVCEIQDELNTFAPPYCYFGNHVGDGSDFGFWPSMDEIDELPRVNNSDEAKELGEDCVFVNDHGNVIVYGGDGSTIVDFV